MAIAPLTDDHKTFLVVRLACYASPSKLRADFKETFGRDVSASQLSYYNPLTAQGAADLGDDWKRLFWATRKKYQDEVASVPIADKWYRLLRLQEIVDDPDMSKSSKTLMKALEQAAKEEGGLYQAQGDSPDADRRIEELLAFIESAGKADAAGQAGSAQAGDPGSAGAGTGPDAPAA